MHYSSTVKHVPITSFDSTLLWLFALHVSQDPTSSIQTYRLRRWWCICVYISSLKVYKRHKIKFILSWKGYSRIYFLCLFFSYVINKNNIIRLWKIMLKECTNKRSDEEHEQYEITFMFYVYVLFHVGNSYV